MNIHAIYFILSDFLSEILGYKYLYTLKMQDLSTLIKPLSCR